MKKSYGSRLAGTITVAFFTLVLVGSAFANPITFEFTFDGTSRNNSALVTGIITFEDSLLLNSSGTTEQYTIGGPEILDLVVDITGASTGNGRFEMSAWNFVNWKTNGVLDLTRELVGQPTDELAWGTSDLLFRGGEFNLFGNAVSPIAPFTFFVPGGSETADSMTVELTSFVPVGIVPEPTTILLFGLGLLGLVGVSRRKE